MENYDNTATPSELGDNASTIVNFAGKKAKSIHAGHLHACAILEDDSAMCWGSGANGQLGTGSNTGTTGTPVAVAFPSGSIVKSLEALNINTSTTLDNSTNNVWCWGYGQRKSSGYTPESSRCPSGRLNGRTAIPTYFGPCARAIEW